LSLSLYYLIVATSWS